MPSRASSTSTTKQHSNSPLSAYHSNVVQAMCTQMVHKQQTRASANPDAPLPLARKSLSPKGSPSSQQSPLKDSVKEEMARRVKADRVLQDLSSDKSRQQARARETARRNKWANTVASTCPPVKPPMVRTVSSMATGHAAGHAKKYDGSRRKNPQVA